MEAAGQVGVVREGGVGQLDDGVIGQVVGLVRPVRADGHGAVWEALLARREQISEWVERDLTVTKTSVLLGRQGVGVPYRTLHRFCVECCGFAGRRPTATVRVADGKPWMECQIDFGELGLLCDPVAGRRHKVHAAYRLGDQECAISRDEREHQRRRPSVGPGHGALRKISLGHQSGTTSLSASRCPAQPDPQACANG